MALRSRTAAHVLPCGRTLDDLWDDLWDDLTDEPTDDRSGGSTGDHAAASRGQDAHPRHCPHCRTARSSLHALAAATRAVYDDDKSLAPPPTLQGRIMSAVRAEVRRSNRFPLEPGPHGPVDVSAQAVAVVLRFAADSVDGVRARRCRLREVEGGAVRVDLSLSLRFGPGTSTATVEVVRRRVTAAASAQVGLDVDGVDIEVEDLWDPER